MPAWVAPLIAIGGSMLSSYLSKQNQKDGPPNAPEYDWIKSHGPGIWSQLSASGMRNMNRPEGIGQTVKAGMARDYRASSSAGLQGARRQNEMRTQQAGLSPGGGESQRREYLASRGFAEDVGRGLSQIEILDFQAKEAQRARGENLLINLTRNAPAYAQLASQNYWNSLAQSNLDNQAIGGAIGSAYDMYYNAQNPYTNPYSTGQGNNFSDPNVPGGQGQDNSGWN